MYLGIFISARNNLSFQCQINKIKRNKQQNRKKVKRNKNNQNRRKRQNQSQNKTSNLTMTRHLKKKRRLKPGKINYHLCHLIFMIIRLSLLIILIKQKLYRSYGMNGKIMLYQSGSFTTRNMQERVNNCLQRTIL